MSPLVVSASDVVGPIGVSRSRKRVDCSALLRRILAGADLGSSGFVVTGSEWPAGSGKT